MTAMAAATKRPGQVLGLHFFNPVPLMKLVEVVRTILTDEAAVTTATEWVQRGRQGAGADQGLHRVHRQPPAGAVPARRHPGLRGRARLAGGHRPAMKLGCGYPMGPFTLLDLVGLDTTMYVAEVMFDEFREARYAPPPLLKRMVMAGQLGRKTGTRLLHLRREVARAPRGRAAAPSDRELPSRAGRDRADAQHSAP